MIRRYNKFGAITFYDNKTILNHSFELIDAEGKETFSFEIEVECTIERFLELNDNEKIKLLNELYVKSVPNTRFKNYIEEKVEIELRDSITKKNSKNKFIWIRVYCDYYCEDEKEEAKSVFGNNYQELMKNIVANSRAD